jgi:glycerol dehydrogenase
MISTTLFPGRYVQGYDALKRLGVEMSRFGQKGFVICDSFVFDHLLPKFRKSVEEAIEITVERFGGECSDEEIERLANFSKSAGCDLIVGIGGGKTLDTAKAVAYELKVPVTIVPTIASTDAPCSALSVIYTPEGKFKRYLVLPKNPDLVLVDTKVIAQSPVRFLVAGMGDALATWFEAESCKKRYAGNMTGDIGSMTAYALARLCYETLLEYGVLAKSACEAQVVTPALEHIVEANILLSGLGFESGGLASAHAIHNGLTVLEQTHRYYHGEKVAIGTLASLFLTDKPKDIIGEVYSFCELVGLPTTLAEIGLSSASDEDLMKVAETACAEGETIHNEPIPVTPEMVFYALKAANFEGARRKGIKK